MATIKQLLDSFGKWTSHWCSYDDSARIDISNSITPHQTWEGSDVYIPPKDGYVVIVAENVYSLYLSSKGLTSYQTANNINGASGKFFGAVFLPCKKGQGVSYHVAPHIKDDTTVVKEAHFIPFLGQN